MAAVNGGIEIWRYVLCFCGAANRRSGRREIEGFLLRDGGGYGCVQPWPEFEEWWRELGDSVRQWVDFLEDPFPFEPDAFSERLGDWQPGFHPPGGPGLGFDDLLKNLEWRKL